MHARTHAGTHTHTHTHVLIKSAALLILLIRSTVGLHAGCYHTLADNKHFHKAASHWPVACGKLLLCVTGFSECAALSS